MMTVRLTMARQSPLLRDGVIDTPTMKRKKGKMRSVERRRVAGAGDVTVVRIGWPV